MGFHFDRCHSRGVETIQEHTFTKKQNKDDDNTLITLLTYVLKYFLYIYRNVDLPWNATSFVTGHTVAPFAAASWIFTATAAAAAVVIIYVVFLLLRDTPTVVIADGCVIKPKSTPDLLILIRLFTPAFSVFGSGKAPFFTLRGSYLSCFDFLCSTFLASPTLYRIIISIIIHIIVIIIVEIKDNWQQSLKATSIRGVV